MREGILDLADGRRLPYAEWGPRDATAIIYCHGFPGSRRELLLSEPVLESSGVSARLIAMNRPGYGPSTLKRGYRFLDWPIDVDEAADKLGVEGFAVLGASGGCPFALACGYALADRVSRISIVVGTTPLEATGMSDAPGITNIPTSPLMRRLQFRIVSLGCKTRLRDPLVDRIHRDLGDVDRHVLRRPELRARFMEVVREAFADGGRTAAGEAELYLRPWGFDVAEVRAETLLWYAGEDRMVPASAGRWLADRLPNSHYTLWPHHGHFSWAADHAAIDVIARTAQCHPHDTRSTPRRRDVGAPPGDR